MNHTLRLASTSDLELIYRMQNVPLREQILDTPLLSLEQFTDETSRQLGSTQFYFLHEQDGQPQGFIHLLKTPETCQPTIWGKWLNTLVYAGGKTTFDILQFPKLNWSVRKNNKRAIRSYELFRFRRTGNGAVCNITQGFGFIAVGAVILYELTVDEYREREDFMRQSSLPLVFEC